MSRKRILFVDDDVPILKGLRVRLHRLSAKWDMHFVESGARALEELESQHFDVVVSDIRMPGMDGVALLRMVSERWPDAIRIVLSGYAELEQAVRLVPYAHQYLSKPCESPHLENLIERCLNLHELLRQPALRAVVGRIRKLPMLPAVYSRLQTALTDDSVGAREVAELVASDAAIAAKVLQLVNSAFFKLARHITKLEQAVSYLGLATIRNLVLSAEIFSLWPAAESGPLNLERLHAHVHFTAAAAHSLAANTEHADGALLAGLLHDVGYWILALECKDDLTRSVELAARLRLPLHEAEVQVIGASHAQVGAYLLGLWGLPFPVVEAVAHHHVPQSVRQSTFDVLGAVAVAHALSPVDDTKVFDAELIPDPAVDASYLSSMSVPFDWAEAAQRVARTFASSEEAT